MGWETVVWVVWLPGVVWLVWLVWLRAWEAGRKAGWDADWKAGREVGQEAGVAEERARWEARTAPTSSGVGRDPALGERCAHASCRPAGVEVWAGPSELTWPCQR